MTNSEKIIRNIFRRKIENLEQRIGEKSIFFLVLEKNLKEKIYNLAEHKEKTCLSLKEKFRLRQFEEKSNLDFKEFRQEKTNLRRYLMSSPIRK